MTAQPVRWWWVRHAPTDASGFCGWTNVEADLSDRATLDRLRAALPPAARLLTSDLRRARETAEALRRPDWIAAPPETALREMHMGAWEGLDYDAVPADLAKAFWRAPATTAPPGGESFVDLQRRVASTITARNAELAGAETVDVVCVAHAGVIRAALALALDLAPASALSFAVAPLSLTRIDWFGETGGWGVQTVNATAPPV